MTGGMWRLRGKVGQPSINERRKRFNIRLRAAFIAGAEADSRRRRGRSLTADELERVLRRYPGDVGW